MDYIQWLRRVDQGFRGHCLFTIEEVYLWDRVKELVQSQILENKNLPFNYEEIDADLISPVDLREKLEALPLFADKRYLIIENAPLKKDRAKDPLLEVLSDFIKSRPDHICVFLAFMGTKPFRGSLFKSFETEFERVDLARLNRRQLGQFVKKRLAGKGLDISAEAINMLVDASEYDIRDSEKNLYDLANLTDRIGGLKISGRLEAADIESSIIGPLERNIYAFTDALAERNIKKAFLLLQGYKKQGQDLYRLFYSMSRQVRNLISAKILNSGFGAGRSGAQALKLPPFIYKKLLKNSGNYKLEELIKIQDKIFLIEKNMKTETFDMERELEIFVTSLYLI